MTDRELKERLITALDHAAPDDVEGVLARCAPRDRKVVPLESRKKTKKWIPAALAACLALVLVGGGAGYYVQNQVVASIVSLDVNPSVELTVNRKETVLSATPTNADAEIILDGMDLTGAKVDVAMNAIVGSLLKNGYVDELANSILITVEDSDAARGERLQQALTAQADAILSSAQINGAILSQTIQDSQQLQQLAAEYGISAGKAALIQAVVDGSGGLHTFQELVGLSINELNLLYSALNPSGSQGESGGETTTAPIQSSGQANDSAYIGIEAAQAAAFAHAGVTAEQVVMLETEYDYEDGRMVYEIEFLVGTREYEYDIDAMSGQVVKSKTEGGQSGGQTGGATQGQTGGGGQGQAGDIGQQAAVDAALSDAGVSQSQVSGLKVERDYDDGRLEYEIEFWKDNVEYDYVIHGSTGSVLESQRETHASASSGDIGEAKAKEIALSRAGYGEGQVYQLEINRDYDDGRLEYEVEFAADGWEYECKIDGSTGSVLEFERDQ